jgi:hypothetical protein
MVTCLNDKPETLVLLAPAEVKLRSGGDAARELD